MPVASGVLAPDFTLIDVVSGQPVTLSAILGGGVVLDFWSVECPWSRYYDDYLAERGAAWAEQGVTLALIDSNANEPPDVMRDMADAYGLQGPILHDPGSAVADLYGAITTPHIFVVAPTGLVIYQGAIDDRSFRQQAPTINYLDLAVAALLAGETPQVAESQAYGCAIVRSG